MEGDADDVANFLKPKQTLQSDINRLDDLALPDNHKIIKSVFEYKLTKKLPKIKKRQLSPNVSVDPVPTTILKSAIKSSSSNNPQTVQKRVSFEKDKDLIHVIHYEPTLDEHKSCKLYIPTGINGSSLFFPNPGSSSILLQLSDVGVTDIPGLGDDEEFLAIKNARFNSKYPDKPDQANTHSIQNPTDNICDETMTPPGIQEQMDSPSTEPRKGASPFNFISLSPRQAPLQIPLPEQPNPPGVSENLVHTTLPILDRPPQDFHTMFSSYNTVKRLKCKKKL